MSNKHGALRRGLAAPTTLIVGLLAAPALAQPAATPAAEPAALEELVVTAQKREEGLLDVPIAISAFSEATLQRAGAQDLAAVAQLAPNFSISPAFSIPTIVIRGVGGGGRTIGFESRAGAYLDGVYVGQSAALNQNLLDLQRVEILKGPQGHLFGQNTVSGAVSLVTNPAGPEASAEVRGAYGDHGQVRLAFIGNAPISDRLFARLAVSHEERDGIMRNTFDGSRLDDVDRTVVRGKLRALLGEDATFDLAADYSHQDTRGTIGQNTTGSFGQTLDPPPPRNVVAFNSPISWDVEEKGVAATLATPIGHGLTFTSISAYRTTERQRRFDLDFSALDLFSYNYADAVEQFSQELRVASADPDRRARFVAGLYLYSGRDEQNRTIFTGAQVGQTPFGVRPNASIPSFASIRNQSWAVFGAFDYDLTSTLTLNTGLRYTEVGKSFRFDLDASGVDAAGRPVSRLGTGTVHGLTDKLNESALSPTIGLSFKPTEALLLYAKYSRGFKSGGWNPDFLNAAQLAQSLKFDKEQVDAFEVGLKGRALENRLQFEAAGFYSLFKDYQVSQAIPTGPSTSVFVLKNAAEVESYGLEATLRAAPAAGLVVTLSGAWTPAKFKSFPNGGGVGVDFSGNFTEYAPEYSASTSVEYRRALGSLPADLVLYVDASYRSKQYADASNAPRHLIEGYTLVNGRISLEGETGWQASIVGNNLFDKDYDLSALRNFFGAYHRLRGVGRLVSVELRQTF